MATKPLSLHSANGKLAYHVDLHLDFLKIKARMSRKVSFLLAVSHFAGRPMHSETDAYEWLLDDHMREHPEMFFKGQEQAILTMRRGFKRVRIQAAADKEAARARAEADAAREIAGKEFYASLAWRELRYKVLKKRSGRCEACGKSARDHGAIIHVDHIFSRSEYPDLALEETNLQVLCDDCNIGKGTADTTDWRAPPC